MESEEVKKSLWHAFDVLDTTSQIKKTRTSLVQKTKLRVLTNNLGHLLSVEQAETIWDKVTEDSIDFNHFITVLNNNLLVGLDKHPETRQATLISEIDNLCWMLCENAYRQRILSDVPNGDNHENGDNLEEEDLEEPMDVVGGKPSPKIFPSKDCFKIWKIFNFLVERAEDGSLLFPLRTDIEEADRIATIICQSVGLPPPKVNPNQRRGSVDVIHQSFLLDFSDFVKVLVRKVVRDNDTQVISQGITEVFNQITFDIVRKGYMVKFGNKVTAWKERWFVLTATELRYFANAEEKDLKGSIILSSECFTQSFPDKPGGKHHRFKLHTQKRQYELSAPDLKSKNEWMEDIKVVVSSIGKSKGSLQHLGWKERKKERAERRRRTAEEELNRCAEREKLLERERELEEEREKRQLAQAEIKERERLLALERQKRAEEDERRRQETNELLEEKRREIEAERQRCEAIEKWLRDEKEKLLQRSREELEAEREQRALVEAKLHEEEAELEEERRRLKELEEAKAALEALVEEERALKRDEEIVRNLQAKILEEEYAKREELERLQAQQSKKLMEEQLSRQELEAAHRQKEEALRLAKEQLDALTREREQADQQLREAAEKLRLAENERTLMLEKMKVRAMTSSSRMARPLPTPNPNPFVTHRGPGAFIEDDFHKGRRPSEEEEDLNRDKLDRQLSNATEAVTLNAET
ncbi:unnamed protein product [Lymnaea stagnalis]|uniref:PH domain-containing protein n=1 Tax=Lymnaea stagnalis TaxID=6523 RepID=A0AAV2IA46_LYMST